MIIANLATYPERQDVCINVVNRIAPQVDLLNVVLSEYDHVPAFLNSFSNVHADIPTIDLKDVGKFYPTFGVDDFVFLIDDDIAYPDNYISNSLSAYQKFGGEKVVLGYHASIYIRPDDKRLIEKGITKEEYKKRPSSFRQILDFTLGLDSMYLVDQLGTGTVVARGGLMPPLSYMNGSQGFCDVRFSRWCFERGVRKVVLPRPQGYLSQQPISNSLLNAVTRKRFPHIEAEILTYASKEKNIGARVKLLNKSEKHPPA